MHQVGDDGLLDAAQAGDRAALDALLRLHRERVFRYGLRVCPTTEDAEDAVQQTLWSAARSIGGFRRASSIASWLFVIVRNHCLRMLGREPIYADLDQLAPQLVDPAPGPEEESARREVEALLSGALARLEPAHREIVLLRDVRGLTAPEVGAALGIGIAAVKSRLHRARTELRRHVLESAG
jgi:RNA polymerase sigma-70 factor (ECF subfamily)